MANDTQTEQEVTQIWQVDRFLNSVRGRIQDNTVWLRFNRPATFTDAEEDGRWAAEDLVAHLLSTRPYVKGVN